MAEARAACRPVPAIGLHSFRVDPALHTTQVAMSSDGFVLYVPHPYFLWKSLKRLVHETRTQVQTLLWPLRPRFVIGFIAGFAAYVSGRPTEHWLRSGRLADVIWSVDSLLPFTKLLPTPVRVAYLATTTASAVILVTVFIQKCFLRMLLSYHGWLFEERGQTSNMTKIWAACLKYGYLNRGLVAGKPLLFAFQYALPSLKPPRVQETVDQFLVSMKPVMSESEFAELTEEAHAFVKTGTASTLQSYLWTKSLLSRNYVTDWWIRFVYLRGRSSLFVNSNFYGIADGNFDVIPTNKQLPRAAVIIHHWLLARQLIDRERLPPYRINNLVPLCMDQYTMAFNCVRIPGRECDTLRCWDMDESRHIVVIYKGVYYSLVPFTDDTRRILTPTEIMSLLQGIVESHEDSQPQPTKIAALTTLDRATWAAVREEHLVDLGSRHNRQTLDHIERAMFIVNLDDNSPKTFDDAAMGLFCSDGTDRWCDKSFSFVVFKNGKAGIHTEHTWADAPVIAHLFEWCLACEAKSSHMLYTKSGDLNSEISPKGTFKWSDIPWGPRTMPDTANMRATQLLQWRITPELQAEIDKAEAGAVAAMNDLDLKVTMHDKYGKNLVKKAGVSPDAWIQAALQLAYFRDQGRFDLTYESSMTRLFYEGRTETIRSCSAESCAFVRAMENKSSTKEECIKLLKASSERHVNTSRLAMTGHGVDRHLFALYVVAVGKNIEAPFLKKALTSPWKLSTSQVPQRQTPSGLWPNNDSGDVYYSPSGGFGPVADDGYGVSYSISGELRFFFHVSSKKKHSTTDSARMQKQIHQALADLAALFEK
ncbi:Carnitine O-acetyltransferase [Diplonema papillatum]|nr:Carnitine O-acetyltransferase [Diplonema papillatum]